MKRGPPLGVSSLVSLASLLAACSGGPGGDQERDAGPDDPLRPFVPGQAAAAVFSCDRSAKPPELPLPRLSRTQLESTLRFAIRLALPQEENEIWT